jgi:hypothetical protein
MKMRLSLSVLLAVSALALLGVRPEFTDLQQIQTQLGDLRQDVDGNTLAIDDIGGHEIVVAFSSVDTTAFKTVTAECPPGKVVLGGGGRITFLPGSGNVGQAFANNYPNTDSSWRISVRSPVTTQLGWQATAYAVCASL